MNIHWLHKWSKWQDGNLTLTNPVVVSGKIEMVQTHRHSQTRVCDVCGRRQIKAVSAAKV